MSFFGLSGTLQLLTEAFAAGHEDATFGSLKNGRVGG